MDTDKTIPAEIIRSPLKKYLLISFSIFAAAILLLLLIFSGGSGNDKTQEGIEAGKNYGVSSSASSSQDIVTVVEGTAIFGTDLFAEDKNSPVRKVEMKGFRICRKEITNKQYYEFIRNSGHLPPSSEFWPASRYRAGEEDFPVTGISRDDASDYCRYYGMRLPNEEEWEFAARTEEGDYYPWGNEADPAGANIGSGFPAKVGTSGRDVNRIGINDLAGNVREWTSSEVSIRNTQGYDVLHYIVRGGSWDKIGGIVNARFTNRGFIRAGDVRTAYSNIGFRCVADEE